jgi:hypothetical protein
MGVFSRGASVATEDRCDFLSPFCSRRPLPATSIPRIIEFRDPGFVALPRRTTFGIQGSNDSQQNERGKAYRSDSRAHRQDKQMRQKTWGCLPI